MKSANNFASIAALDLDPIKVKLMHEESGEGWSRAYVDSVEVEYRRFLYLVKEFPNEQAAPLFDVDVFWHYHILDTMKYAADCDAVFGYFLHHFPYVGLRGEEDLEAHHRAGERMRELYEQTFGEAYIRQEVPAYAAPRGKVAFSSPAGNETMSMRADKAAFSSPMGKVAFSSPMQKVAFSSPMQKVAFSSPMGKVAFSSPMGKVASSPLDQKFAFSSPMTQSGAAGEAGETAGLDLHARTAATKFYSVRPTLSSAA